MNKNLRARPLKSNENHLNGCSLIIGLGCDHAGYKYKESVKKWLENKWQKVIDYGTYSSRPVDYPLFIRPVAQAVARRRCDRGIVFGGSGNGEAMVANRVRGVRCALCWDEKSAELGRRHNNANMISIGQKMVDLKLALRIVDIFLKSPFDRGRHLKRVKMIDRL